MPTRFSARHQGHPMPGARPVLLPWPRSWKGEKAETEQNKNEDYLILTSILTFSLCTSFDNEPNKSML